MTASLIDKMKALLTPIAPANDPAGGKSFIAPIVLVIINLLLYAAGIVCIIAIIYGGIMYIASNGDQAKVTKARGSIINGIISAVIVMLAIVAVRIIKNIFS